MIDRGQKYMPPWTENDATSLAEAVLQAAACSSTYANGPGYGKGDSYCDLQDNGGHINEDPFDTNGVEFSILPDPRAQRKGFEATQRIQVDELIKRSMKVTVKHIIVNLNANDVNGRLIHCLKWFGTFNNAAKFWNIAQGYADFERLFVVHDVSSQRKTLRRFKMYFPCILKCMAVL